MPVRIRREAVKDREYQQLLTQGARRLQEQGLVNHGGLLYRIGDGGEQLVVPDSGALRAWILGWAHDAREGGHRGGDRTAQFLRARVYWKGMGEEAQRYARSCDTCQRGKADQQCRQGMPLSIDTPTRAAEVICMDFIGPFPAAASGETSVLVVIDKLTRCVMYIPLGAQTTAQQVF